MPFLSFNRELLCVSFDSVKKGQQAAMSSQQMATSLNEQKNGNECGRQTAVVTARIEVQINANEWFTLRLDLNP